MTIIPAPQAQRSNHIVKVRQCARDLADVLNRIRALDREWAGLSLGANLTDADFTGTENEGLVKNDIRHFLDVVTTATTGIDAVMLANNYDNRMYKII